MVALRVIVHTPYERVALSIPSTLYPAEAAFFVQFLLQQHHSVDPVDSNSPQYVDIVSASPWQLSHLTDGVLKDDRSLFDNGVRDGDVLLFDRDFSTEPVTASAIVGCPTALSAKERLNELQKTGRIMSLVTMGMWVLACVGAAFVPSWWSFGAVAGSLILTLAFIMLVIYRRGRGDAALLGWAALAMAAASGFALPGAELNLTWSTRILIAVTITLVILVLCHLVGTTALTQEPFAALLITLLIFIAGLTLCEYASIPARSIAAFGLLIASIVMLAAPRLALWMSRVKIPLTALIDVDLPLLPQATIDDKLNKKLERARWLQAVFTISGAFLIVASTLPLVGWPWADPYYAPNPWQWVLLSLVVIGLLSTAIHAVYRALTSWILGALLVVTALVGTLVTAMTMPLIGMMLVVVCLLLVSSLWLWATQWNLTPIAQKILEILESVLLAIIFPIGAVASGLVSFLLTL